MKNFLQWHKQSTKNKIIIFSVVFILALCYSFLHRPLGLIMWDRLYYQKEFKLIRADLNEVFDDREKFFKLYHNFYEKENIDEKSKETKKELLHYIDNLEIDLLITTFFGLDELYLQAFTRKIDIYAGILEWSYIYFISNYFKDSYLLTKAQTNDYLSFLQSSDKVLFFVNRLNNDFAKLSINSNIIRIIEVLSKMRNKEICENKDNLLKLLNQANTALQTYKNTESSKNIEGFYDFIQEITNKTKDNFNECK